MSSLKMHWRAPAVMVSTAFVGFVLVLVHHLFYSSLNGYPVPHGDFGIAGRSFSKQQVITFSGTALAFFVKVFLCFAISIAYVQVLWRSVRARDPCPTLSELDWAHASLDNVLSVFDIRVARRYPFLAFLALVFWCIPIATIFPPATLSIVSLPGEPNAMLEVAQVDFTTLKFSDDLRFVTSPGVLNNYYWSGPSQPLQHLAFAVMGLGETLPISPPAPNSSWTLDFWGPSLQCTDVQDNEKNQTWMNIWNYYASNESSSGSFAYLSWVPWSYNDYSLWYDNLTTAGINRNLPFLFNVRNGPSLMGPPTTAVSTDDAMSLFLAVLPAAQRVKAEPGRVIFDRFIGCEAEKINNLDQTLNCTSTLDRSTPTMTPAMAFEQSTLVRCDVYNTSYSANFSFMGGNQNISISQNPGDALNLARGSKWVMAPHPAGDPDEAASLNCASFQRDPRLENNGTACVFDLDAVRSVSYQSIVAAFNERVLGDIRNGDSFVGLNTTITQTMLGDTEELAFVRDWRPEAFLNPGPNLQALLANRTEPEFAAIIAKDNIPNRGSLRSNLEELFLNFTLSLHADPFFRPNYDSPFAPSQLVNVSLQTFTISFRYDVATFWISYGLSLFATLLALLAGSVAMVLNGASFSNEFSTIARISRSARMSVDIKDEDAVGKDPLPSYLKNARLDVKSLDLPYDQSGFRKANSWSENSTATARSWSWRSRLRLWTRFHRNA